MDQIREISIMEIVQQDESLVDLFSSLWWINIYSQNMKMYGVFDKNGKIVSYFGVYEKRIGILKIFKAAPFSAAIPCWLGVLPSNKSNKNSLIKRRMAYIACTLKKHANIITVPFSPRFQDMQPFVWQGYKAIVRYTYRIDLSKGMVKIITDMSASRRNSIEKARKDGIQCLQCFDQQLITRFIDNTFERKKKKIESKLVESIISKSLLICKAYSRVAYLNGRPIAMAFCVIDGDTAYYIFGGYDREFKKNGAGALCVLNCIEEAMNRKLKYFDFEGSMIPEVEAYFRDFGADLLPYYVANYAPLILDVLLKVFKKDAF